MCSILCWNTMQLSTKQNCRCPHGYIFVLHFQRINGLANEKNQFERFEKHSSQPEVHKYYYIIYEPKSGDNQ